jgi:hypothetical protein
MGDSDSSGDERPLGERKQKLMLKAGFGLSKSHSNSPSNYPSTESQTHPQAYNTGLADSIIQTGESAQSLGQEALCPDLAAQDDKDGGAANQRPRRLSAGSKPQTRPTASATSGAASSGGRTAALRDSGGSQAARGRRAGRGSARGAGAAGRRGRGRRGR